MAEFFWGLGVEQAIGAETDHAIGESNLPENSRELLLTNPVIFGRTVAVRGGYRERHDAIPSDELPRRGCRIVTVWPRHWLEGGDWLNVYISASTRKRVGILILVFGVSLAGFLAWKSEHEKVLSKNSLDPSMIYQDGFPAASIRSMEIDPTTNAIVFDVITASHKLNMTKTFEFRDWKLMCAGKEDSSMTFGAMMQINYINVICLIQGAH